MFDWSNIGDRMKKIMTLVLSMLLICLGHTAQAGRLIDAMRAGMQERQETLQALGETPEPSLLTGGSVTSEVVAQPDTDWQEMPARQPLVNAMRAAIGRVHLFFRDACAASKCHENTR